MNRLLMLLAGCFLALAGASRAAAGAAADPAGELLRPLAGAAQARGAAVARLLGDAVGGDEAARKLAAEALARLGPQDAPAAPHFAAALADARVELRRAAAGALARIGSPELAVLGALAGRLRDADLETRALAARALGAPGPAGKAAVAVLAQALADAEPAVRVEAAGALGRLRAEGRPALQGLVRVLADKDAGVRRAAARALGRVGDPAALAALLGFLQGAAEEADLDAACSAFLDLGEAAAPVREVLRQRIYSRKERWTPADIKGLGALAAMTGRADPYAKDLAALLKDAARKRPAAEALERAPAAAAGVAWALIAGLKDPAVAPACARALGRIGAASRTAAAPPPEELAPALVGLLESDDQAVLVAALRALGDVGDLAAAPEVARRAAKFSGAAEVWSLYALARLKQEPDRAMERLRAMAAAPWALRRTAWAVIQYLEAGGRGEVPDEGG